MTERAVQRAAVKALEGMGWAVTVTSIPRRAYQQLTGLPDIYVTHAGKKKQVWIEVKAKGKKVEPGSEQDRWLARTAASGALCIVIDSVDDLLDKLERMGCL